MKERRRRMRDASPSDDELLAPEPTPGRDSHPRFENRFNFDCGALKPRGPRCERRSPRRRRSWEEARVSGRRPGSRRLLRGRPGRRGAGPHWVARGGAPHLAGPFPARRRAGSPSQPIRRSSTISVGGSAGADPPRQRVSETARSAFEYSVYVGIAGGGRAACRAGRAAADLRRPGRPWRCRIGASSRSAIRSHPRRRPWTTLAISIFTAGETGAPTSHCFSNANELRRGRRLAADRA
jgi:hypothetical protein